MKIVHSSVARTIGVLDCARTITHPSSWGVERLQDQDSGCSRRSAESDYQNDGVRGHEWQIGFLAEIYERSDPYTPRLKRTYRS